MKKRVILTGKQVAEFEKLALEGYMPAELAILFGISISSVHNLKKNLRVNGTDLPSVKGQRPKGWISLPRVAETEDELEVNSEKGAILVEKSFAEGSVIEQDGRLDCDEPHKITINGIQYFISPAAKEIYIKGKNVIEVIF